MTEFETAAKAWLPRVLDYLLKLRELRNVEQRLTVSEIDRLVAETEAANEKTMAELEKLSSGLKKGRD